MEKVYERKEKEKKNVLVQLALKIQHNENLVRDTTTSQRDSQDLPAWFLLPDISHTHQTFRYAVPFSTSTRSSTLTDALRGYPYSTPGTS